MEVQCPKCNKVSEFPDDQLPFASRVLFTCPGCKNKIELDLGSTLEQDGPPAPTKTEQAPRPKESAPRSDEQQPGNEALKKKILRTVGDLPPMPQVVHKAREVMANTGSSFKDLAIVIVADQAIATKVLRLANSAYYGLSGRVSSIQHASVVLGQHTLAELLTMASTSKLMDTVLTGYGLEAEEMWQHSLAVAFGARLIATMKSPVLADDAFSAGLIHDAGKLVLDKYVHEKKQDFERFMSNGNKGFLAAEKEILGLDHAEIGAEVCKNWNVPDHLAVAIQYHHCPSQLEENTLGYILHVADALAMVSELGSGIDALSYEMDQKAPGLLGLDKKEMKKLMGQMVASVQKTLQELGS